MQERRRKRKVGLGALTMGAPAAGLAQVGGCRVGRQRDGAEGVAPRVLPWQRGGTWGDRKGLLLILLQKVLASPLPDISQCPNNLQDL